MGLAVSEQELILFDEVMRAEYARRSLSYKPNKKQELFHEAGLYAQERLITGGNRSGKTWAGENELKKHATGDYWDDWKGYRYDRPIRIWAVGKNATVVAETLQRDLFGDKEAGTEGIFHSSQIAGTPKKSGSSQMYRTAYIPHVAGGKSKITFKTWEEGVEAFQSAKVDFILHDEEPPFNIYQECKMRTTSTSSESKDSHRMMVVCSTPLKGYTEFFNYFMNDRHPETVKDSIWYAHIEWDDAEHLPASEKKRLLSGMTPYEIEARTRGIPWHGSGMVYPVPLSMLLCNPFEIPKYWPRVFGIDFGWKHPTALIFGAHDRDNDVLYLYAEYAVSERTPEAHVNALQIFGINWIPGVYDPAGKISRQGDGENLINLYREAGIKNITKAKNSKEEGIQKTLQRMQAGQLKIFNTLSKTIAELTKYARDEDGIPKDENDDIMDSMRYLVMSGLPIAVPENHRDPSYHGRYGMPKRASYI